MLKNKQNLRYRLIRRYKTDFFGDIYSKGFFIKWSDIKQKYKIMYKNIKVIHQRIKERLVEKLDRRKSNRHLNKGKRGVKRVSKRFEYRVDIVKLRPKSRRKSLFLKRLRNRHKIRNFAGLISVAQYRTYIKKSQRSSRLLRKFYQLIESRLDTIIYRMNLISTPSEGRQKISHLNFMVNGIVAKSPSQQISFFDIVSVSDPAYTFYLMKYRLKKVIKHIIRKKKVLKRFSKTLRVGEIFMNSPVYLEINYRILACMLVFLPKVKHLYYPFKCNKRGLASVGRRFS